MAEQTSEEPIKPTQESPLKRNPNRFLSKLSSLNPFKKQMSEEEWKKFEERGKIHLQEAEVQTRIEEKLKNWLTSVRPGIEERADGLGLDKNDIDFFSQKLMDSFWWEMHKIRNPGGLAELKTGASLKIQEVKDETLKSQLDSAIKSTTSLSLLNLIDKKLSDQELTKTEQLLLDYFLFARLGEIRTGEYDFFTHGIKIPLLGSDNLETYSATLHHEFTHFILHRHIPKSLNIRWQQMQDEKSGKAKTETESQKFFVQLMIAIDESCAHRAEKFYKGNDPYFEGYKDQVDPHLFRMAYKIIDGIAQGKTIGEFDQAAILFYKHFVSQWKEDLTMPQLFEIVGKTFREEGQRLKTTPLLPDYLTEETTG